MYRETVAEQPLHETEKSFDPLASVNMLRYDFDHFGTVLPETRERVRDEELSLLVEGVDRAARTEFVLKRDGDDLSYYKNGRWQSYTSMLQTGERVAKAEASLDYRRQFLAEDAVRDLSFGYKMRVLQPGQQLVWASPYRYDIEERYGADFMEQCGRFPDRKMGFLYRAFCDEAGNVVLESQTIDRSDDSAITSTLWAGAQNPTADMDTLVEVYDAQLAQKYGGEFYAGRRNAELRENAWTTLLAQTDLTEYFLSKLEAIAARPVYGRQLEDATKRHMYGVWAAFKKRIDGTTAFTPISQTQAGIPVAYYAVLEHEVHDAFNQFVSEGQVMIGCGGAITMLQSENGILNASAADIFKSIFGGSGTDKFGPLEFTCTKGHYNRRPRNQLIDNCKSCGEDVSCKSPEVKKVKKVGKIMRIFTERQET